MKKFILYRNRPDGADINQRPELIAVEIGPDIISVTEDLMASIKIDLDETPEYLGSACQIHPPELERTDPATGKREYSMIAAVIPMSAPRNTLVEYTVFEDDEAPRKIVDTPGSGKRLK